MCEAKELKAESGRLKEKGKPMSEPKQSKPKTDEQLGRYCIKAMNRIIQQGCNAKPEDENKDAAQFVLDHIASLQRELAAQSDQFKREVEDAFKEGVAVGRLQSAKDAHTLYLAVSRARKIVEGNAQPSLDKSPPA